MVEDHSPAVAYPDRVIVDSRHIAEPRTDEADDNVVGMDAERIVANGDSPTRRGLAGDRDPSVADDQRRLEPDGPADIEDDDPRVPGVDGRAQRARSAIVEVGDPDDPSAAAAEARRPRPFRSGKGGNLRRQLRRRAGGEKRRENGCGSQVDGSRFAATR